MAPHDGRRSSKESREDGFEGRDLLVGRPEGAEGRSTAGAAQAPLAAMSSQPGAHDDAIREILATVRATAARIEALQDAPEPENETAEALAREAAALLGLHGPVKPKRFEYVLAGYVPGTDLRLGRLRDGEHQHRPGVDVTFSAPKSVSLEALVYAPGRTGARVVRAHDEAVRATLGFIEAELLQTRRYDRATGRRPRVQADGMAAATFRHLASRNLDPQLHTHAVIANMTRGRDGGWRNAEFTSVERSKLLIGAYYRNELRTRLETIGYATVPTLVGRMPGFEIAGYQRPMLDAFSTRRRELLDYMQDRGWENTPARTQQAALYTRRRKAEPERQVLHEAWQARA